MTARFEADLFEYVAATPGTVLLRLGGRWVSAQRERLPPPMLLLDAGTWVVLDRFVDSSLAYQGAGRGLGVDAVRQLNAFGVGALRPDRTLLLRVDPELGRGRLEGRGEAPDRLEGEDAAFFARVAEAYEALARAEPGRVRVLEAAGAPEEVLAAALRALADLVPAG